LSKEISIAPDDHSLQQKLITGFFLAILALTGNVLSLPLFFGVDLIFGSVAVMLAITLLGTIPALFVAVVGGLYTLVLWGHPYALIIFSLEALVVGTLYKHSKSQNLVLLDLSFWLLLGVPLVIIFYSSIIGLEWKSVVLIALKQPLNGTFNALLAGLLLLFLQLFAQSSDRIQLPAPHLEKLLFHVLLTAILVSGGVPIVNENYRQRLAEESYLHERLLDSVQLTRRKHSQWENISSEQIQEKLSKDPVTPNSGIALIGTDGQILYSRGKITSLSDKGQIQTIKTSLSIWLPSEDMPTMKRWRKGRYVVQDSISGVPGVSHLLMESATESLVHKMEQNQAQAFIFLLLLLSGGIVVSRLLSHWLTLNLSILESASKDLPNKIAQGKRPEFPKSLIHEYRSLGNILTQSANSLAHSFHDLTQIKEQLELTVEKRSEELDISEKRWLYALEGSREGVWDWNISTKEMFYSTQWKANLGYNETEITGSFDEWDQRIHPEDRERCQADLYQTLYGKTPFFSNEHRMLCKDGSYKWILARGQVVERDTNNNPIRVIGTHRDISEDKHADDALKESESLQRAILQTAADAIITIDTKGMIRTFNPAAERIFGYQANEIIGKNISILLPEHERDTHERYTLKSQLHAPRIINQARDLQGCRKDGSLFPLELKVAPMNFANEKGFVGTLRDTTEYKQHEQALLQAKKEAEKANHAKSVFLTSMSHELRTPLNAIVGFGQLIQESNLDEENRDCAAQIVKAGHHLTQMINEILDIARIESGKQQFSLQALPIRDVLEELLSLIQPLSEEKRIRLIRPAETCDAHVYADEKRIKQVLLNLLSNSVKYNYPGGHIRITCTTQKENIVRISIEDSGPGIDQEDLQRVFEPFERLNADRTDVEGTGIGLALSRVLVMAMGGRLGLDSEVGVGSTFWLEFPAIKKPANLAHPETENDIHLEHIKGKTILCIEDNVVNLKLIKAALNYEKSIQLISAMKGEQGVELAVTQTPDLILLDAHLPDISGNQVLSRLKSDPRSKHIPVIVVSADATQTQIDSMLATGAAAYLTKPFRIKEFWHQIESAVKPQIQSNTG